MSVSVSVCVRECVSFLPRPASLVMDAVSKITSSTRKMELPACCCITQLNQYQQVGATLEPQCASMTQVIMRFPKQTTRKKENL